MQTFTTPAPITADLTLPAGRIQIIAADRTDTTVDIRPANPTKNRDITSAQQTTATYTDGVLRIHTPQPKNTVLSSAGSVEITVQLPADSHVRATTAACELRGVGRLGQVTFEGAYNHTKIDEAAALTLTATQGDTVVGRLNGDATITAQSGDITITQATAGTLNLSTQSGDINVTAAAGASATLDSHTGHGRVSNSLKNDGTPTLHIHATTTHGNITARSL
ncbi:DUF4097 domain-containing protein [Streptomonospora sp. S1-112]|uniref:DUF4097 domain-containing protein n=1 Tax=Streptomonospora mangrovi TaxID=2883123 RepID=A0A9X3NM01_9ACTN|nr:DUF4097 family beta strand repeat-containing protein [Streptomonospora mangrovi]MDA0565847.1 DUF4097 domain-containing protein [Streptomonospora mangrovi]